MPFQEDFFLYKGLLVKNKFSNFYLRFVNQIVSCFYKGRKGRILKIQNNPKILLSNIAHLGDAILATCVLPQIKQLYPTSTIGFICGSWSKQVIENHPFVNHVYIVDHFRLNRSSVSIKSKLVRYVSSFRSALSSICKEKYDIAIDLYYFYPNTALLMAMAKIPTRIAYSSGGFGSTLTHPVDWLDSSRFIMEYHFSLLEILQPFKYSINNIRPNLSPITLKVENRFKKILNSNNIVEYMIFHIGVGLADKQWPIEKWMLLLEKFKNKNIIFTGYGEKEMKLIERMILGSTYLNLCNKLSLSDLSCFVKNAQMVICGDTAISHIAMAYDNPCVIIGKSTGVSKHFRPFSKNAINFIAYKQISDIPVNEVYNAAISLNKGLKENF